jgi:hypothetical protein
MCFFITQIIRQGINGHIGRGLGGFRLCLQPSAPKFRILSMSEADKGHRSNNDPRSRIEIVQDCVDSEFSDFYQELGLMEISEEARFNRDEILEFIRVALVRGVNMQAADPGTFNRIDQALKDESGIGLEQ